MKTLNVSVYPTDNKTISVANNHDVYGGAHNYTIENCTGFKDGQTQYSGGVQTIQFVHKADDGTITPGLQSEQVVLMLIDRHVKMNERFPSIHNEKMIVALEMFLEACKERIDDRISRKVMGDLKK